VTSGLQSPTLGHPVALALLRPWSEDAPARPENYNRTVEELERLRSQGRVYLFRPERMPVANGELRYDRIVTAFEAGLAQARRELPAIEAFLAS